MKKYTYLLFALMLSAFATKAQEKVEKLKIFKYHPFSLITGSLNVSQEIFNESSKRSFVIGLGIRYINKKEDYNYYGATTSTYEQFNKWQGGTVWAERRFYVPGLWTGDRYGFKNEKVKFGVYLAPGLKVEYNSNNYDKGGYNVIYPPQKPDTPITQFINNSGKINYMGIMPNMNLGMQFTLFQNLYIDTFIGGGIRFLSKKVINEKIDQGSGNGYFYGVRTEAIENFVIKEGVQANFGFGLGVVL